MVARHEFIRALALLCIPMPAAAQPAGRSFKMGWLAPGPRGATYEQFMQRARQLGYVEGKNLLVHYRQHTSAPDGESAAGELVRLRVDVIVAQAPSALLAARGATATIPIVAFFIGDPLRMGVTRSLARPDTNVTGFTWDAGVDTVVKVLELFREILPAADKIALLWNLNNDSHPYYVEAFEKFAPTLGMSVLSFGVGSADELAGAFARMSQSKVRALAVFTDPFTVRFREQLSALLGRHAIAAMWGSAAWPLKGALVTFGANIADQPARAAQYVDRIFKGTRVAQLPFQQPTKFDLVLDAGVASRLGVPLSRSLRLRADEVVE